MEVHSEEIIHHDEFSLAVKYFFLFIEYGLCFLSAYLFAFHGAVNTFVMNVIWPYIERRNQSPELIRLELQLRSLKAELNLLSPTAEFAAYFRKEREVNKKQDEFDRIKTQHQSTLPSRAKIDTLIRIVIHIAGLILCGVTWSLTALCLADVHFWPFNYLFKFPAIFADSQGSCYDGHIRISLFMFFLLFLSTWKRFSRRIQKVKLM